MKNNVAITLGADIKNMSEKLPNNKQAPIIAAAGFDKVFIGWVNGHWGKRQKQQMKNCKKEGLTVFCAHLGYKSEANIVNFWLEGPAGDKLVKGFKKDINALVKNKINMAMFHLTRGDVKSEPTEIGVVRLKEIIKHAEKKGVIIAIENLGFDEKENGKFTWGPFLEYVFDRIESPNMKICFDCGHNHLIKTFNWQRFGKEIACLHLHDNDETIDRHWLPYDGTLDWNDLAKKLKKYGFKGVITSESMYGKYYEEKMEPQEFFQKAFVRLNEIDKKVNGK